MRQRLSPLVFSALLSVASCAALSAPPAESAPAQATSAQSLVSRLRNPNGTSRIRSFATFHGAPDNETLVKLAKRDLLIVQPIISDDQLHGLQVGAQVVSYLSIGELGTSNTYYVGGNPISGKEILKDPNKAAWCLGDNGNFDSKILDLTRPDVRVFLLEQAKFLLARGFDGLFLDTVDDAEFFAQSGPTTQAYTAGKISLQAGRPDYPAMRRAYIDVVKALRAQIGEALLIQNGGFDLLLDRDNNGQGTQKLIDAVMHEVAVTKANKPHPDAKDNEWPFDPANYETWAANHARVGGVEGENDKKYRANRDALAKEYFRSGGIVLQQDFGEPANHVVQCASYKFAQAVRKEVQKDGWLSAYSDAAFTRLYDYVDTNPLIQKRLECTDYDKKTLPHYDVTFNPLKVNARAGASVTTKLKFEAIAGLTGSVAVSIGTLPTGVRAKLSQSAVNLGANAEISLAVSTEPGIAIGTQTIPIRITHQNQARDYKLRLTTWNSTGDSVFVAHAGLGKVLAFDNSASMTNSASANRSLPNYSLPQASGITLDGQGNQYVVDNVAKGRLQKFPSFSLNSNAATTLAQDLEYATALAIDPQGRTWVSESCTTTDKDHITRQTAQPRIRRFDPGSTTAAAIYPFPDKGPYPFTATTERPAGEFPSALAISGTTLWALSSYGLLYKIDVAAAPVLRGVYNFPTSLNNPGTGSVFAQGNLLWISGTNSGTGTVIKVDTTLLPAPNGIWAVYADIAVKQSIAVGLYDPAGVALDSLGNLWVVNKTGPQGINVPSATTPGSLVRFPAASLSKNNASPDLTLDLWARYPVGLAVGQP